MVTLHPLGLNLVFECLNFRTLQRLRFVNKKIFFLTQHISHLSIYDTDGPKLIKSQIQVDSLFILPTQTSPIDNDIFKDLSWINLLKNTKTLIYDYEGVVSQAQLLQCISCRSTSHLEVVMDHGTQAEHAQGVQNIINTLPSLTNLKIAIDPFNDTTTKSPILYNIERMSNLETVQAFGYNHSFKRIPNLSKLNIFVSIFQDYSDFITDASTFYNLTSLTIREGDNSIVPVDQLLRLRCLPHLRYLNLKKVQVGFDPSLVKLSEIRGIEKVFLDFDIQLTDDSVNHLLAFPPVFTIFLSITIDQGFRNKRLLPSNIIVDQLYMEHPTLPNVCIDDLLTRAKLITTDQDNLFFKTMSFVQTLQCLNTSMFQADCTPFLNSILLCGDVPDNSLKLNKIENLKKIKIYDSIVGTLEFLRGCDLDSFLLVNCTYPENQFGLILEQRNLLSLTLLVSPQILKREQNDMLFQLPYLQFLRTAYCNTMIEENFHLIRKNF
ncbi:hypothetical protein EIN_487220 [Entamoeba invadens IP1]|uniref:F-box domain-containing protein n=1 Tax=Entamoeba invadens IP1 TaxID=370355 RepID=A0A0A1U883_ENTIV|nr:hypothetical protein EIN_487220 [Entamoeba invadens IP1]ELP89240.1 hypothetical protein EIN_487220 [Entamoeba invadens IP1]|eukprot:XP_004256011.1 hypothetical protein EIN_487220 [Entamoeba invadens IP1]